MARRRPTATPADSRVPTPPPVPTPPAAKSPAIPARRVVVLGAGADVAHGMPTIANLMYELADFSRGEGARVHELLKHKVKHLRFTFDKFAGERSHDVLTQLFSDPTGVEPALRGAATKLKADPDLAVVGEALEKLCGMAGFNELTEDQVRGLARIAGEVGDVPASEGIVEPAQIALTHLVGAAIRRSFQDIFARGSRLTEREKEVLTFFIASTSNIEELLSLYFTRYTVGSSADRRTYLYLAWMLWAFLRLRAARPLAPAQSSYTALPGMGADVVTFNYTNFFERQPRPVRFFHGRLDHYLQLDTRKLVIDDQDLQDATDVDSMLPFLARGTVNAARLTPRDVLVPALHTGCPALVLAHNHPTQDPTPSPADRSMTAALRDACAMVGLRLLDHLIVTRTRYFSFRETEGWTQGRPG